MRRRGETAFLGRDLSFINVLMRHFILSSFLPTSLQPLLSVDKSVPLKKHVLLDKLNLVCVEKIP